MTAKTLINAKLLQGKFRSCNLFCLLSTLDAERVDLKAAAGVRVCGDEEEVVANGEGGDIGGQLTERDREKKANDKTRNTLLVILSWHRRRNSTSVSPAYR